MPVVSSIVEYELKRFSNRRNKIFVDLCRGRSVLDVGFLDADGMITKKIISVSSSWMGIDIDIKAVRKAKKHGLDALCGEFEDVNLHKRFDVILLGEVIEHTARPGQMLLNARKHLRSDGNILISTPNPGWWLRGPFITIYPLLWIMRKVGILKPFNDDHVMWFDMWTLENLAKRYNLRIEWIGKPWGPSLIGKIIKNYDT